jgi:hypothetical protein
MDGSGSSIFLTFWGHCGDLCMVNLFGKMTWVSLLLAVGCSWFLAPQFTMVRVECCCSQHEEAPAGGCPCDGDQHCCSPYAAVMRAGVICEKFSVWRFFAFPDRLAHVSQQEKALQRHDAPPLPPPKAWIG